MTDSALLSAFFSGVHFAATIVAQMRGDRAFTVFNAFFCILNLILAHKSYPPLFQ